MSINGKVYYQSMRRLLENMDSACSPEHICSSIVEDVTHATRSKGCSLMLLTPDKKTLLHSAAYGLSDWFVKKGPVSADQSIAETLQGNPIAVMDAPSDERVGYRKQVAREGISSILNVPVKLNEEVIGVMRVYTADRRKFTEDDISFASMAASFGAAALENTGICDLVEHDFESYQRSMRQMRSELDYEWAAEPDVIPEEDKGPMIPPGG